MSLCKKGPYSQSCVFSSSHILMWELDHIEGWAMKNCCFQIVVLEKPFEISLDCKEIKPVNPKGNHPWISIGRTDAEAPVLWACDVKSQLIGKTLMLGRIEGRRRSEWQRMKWLDNITDMNLSKLQEIVKDREAWHATVYGVAKSWAQLTSWTTRHAFLFVRITWNKPVKFVIYSPMM